MLSQALGEHQKGFGSDIRVTSSDISDISVFSLGSPPDLVADVAPMSLDVAPMSLDVAPMSLDVARCRSFLWGPPPKTLPPPTRASATPPSLDYPPLGPTPCKAHLWPLPLHLLQSICNFEKPLKKVISYLRKTRHLVISFRFFPKIF